MKIHQRLQTKGCFCCHCLENEKDKTMSIGILVTNGEQKNPVNVLNPDTNERFSFVVPEGFNLFFDVSLQYEKIII